MRSSACHPWLFVPLPGDYLANSRWSVAILPVVKNDQLIELYLVVPPRKARNLKEAEGIAISCCKHVLDSFPQIDVQIDEHNVQVWQTVVLHHRSKIEEQCSFKSVIRYFRWINATTLLFVTEDGIFQWLLGKRQAPLKLYDRSECLVGYDINDYAIDLDSKWRCLAGTNATGDKQMLLYNTVLKSHHMIDGKLPTFVRSRGVGSSGGSYFVFLRNSSSNGALVLLCTDDLSEGCAGAAERVVPLPPSCAGDDVGDDVLLMTGYKSCVLCFTKLGCCYVYDVTKECFIFSTRFSLNTIKYGVVTPTDVMALCSDGQVTLLSVLDSNLSALQRNLPTAKRTGDVVQQKKISTQRELSEVKRANPPALPRESTTSNRTGDDVEQSRLQKELLVTKRQLNEAIKELDDFHFVFVEAKKQNREEVKTLKQNNERLQLTVEKLTREMEELRGFRADDANYKVLYMELLRRDGSVQQGKSQGVPSAIQEDLEETKKALRLAEQRLMGLDKTQTLGLSRVPRRSSIRSLASGILVLNLYDGVVDRVSSLVGPWTIDNDIKRSRAVFHSNETHRIPLQMSSGNLNKRELLTEILGRTEPAIAVEQGIRVGLYREDQEDEEQRLNRVFSGQKNMYHIVDKSSRRFVICLRQEYHYMLASMRHLKESVGLVYDGFPCTPDRFVLADAFVDAVAACLDGRAIGDTAKWLSALGTPLPQAVTTPWERGGELFCGRHRHERNSCCATVTASRASFIILYALEDILKRL